MPGLSRRRLLRLPVLAATAAGTAWWARPDAARADTEQETAYQKAFRAVLAQDKDVQLYDVPGREFLYRPRQLLVLERDLNRVVARLREVGIQLDVDKGFGGMNRITLATGVDIPGLVAYLRDPRNWPKDQPPTVQPHHVTVGHDNIMGSPHGPPAAAAGPLHPPLPDRQGDGKGVVVGICDTGIWKNAPLFHPLWLGGAYVPEADDEDALYQYADVLALEGGHGTFVAGVLRQAAPSVRFDPEAALGAAGIGDEQMLVKAIERLGRDVSIINLSLGCYTQGDLPPLPVANALAARGRQVITVASAGNSGASRPAWPAALPDVVAVAAVAGNGGKLTPAGYSNFGPWVNVCADGTRTSTYVTGKLRLDGLPQIVFPGYGTWSGTSFAAPHVAGRLAAIMSNAGRSADEARLELLAGPVWQPGYGVYVG